MENTKDHRVMQEVPQLPTADTTEGSYEIDLLELFYRLVENVKYLIIAALVGALLSWAYTTMLVKPKYTATTKLYVLNTGTNISISDLQIGNYLASDYQEVFKNWHVQDMVIDRLNLSYSYRQLGNMITVTNPTGTRILYINATTTDPQLSKDIADTFASVAQEFIATTMDTREPNIFEEALLPTSPSSPNVRRNVIMGFLLGLLVACAIIVVRYMLDDKIHSSEDVEKYVGVPCLGMLPMQNAKGSRSSSQHKRKGGVTA